MLFYILGAIVLIVVAFVVVVLMQPETFSVERSAAIDAPPRVVFDQVNDFHLWEAWSPWAKRDPNMKQTYESAAAGEGAGYAWAGNKEVGEGRMDIVESRPPELIRIRLEFFKPFKGVNDTLFTFRPEGEGTRVTWTMSGDNNFIGKAMGLFVNMDRMIGKDFESGLAEMARVSEAEASPGRGSAPAEPNRSARI